MPYLSPRAQNKKRRAISNRVKELKALAGELEASDSMKDEVRLSEEEKESLKALGYVVE